MVGTRGALWLPFTQMDEFDPATRTFVRGEGNYLIDARGARVFDAISSVWTTVHGHCHPAIVEAINAQAAKLDHSTLLGATHGLAEELAARLAAASRLNRVFFSSDGASAVEAALKIAVHYWQELGHPQRNRFIHLSRAYHGDTCGAMSVSDIRVFKSRYAALTFETRAYDELHEIVQADDVAAVIVEPIVQAAAGMRIVAPRAYEPLANTQSLLIIDEIATGFGRTGTLFASEQLTVRPDILCLGKGLSGGSLPLSATVVSERVFDAFRGRRAEMKHFFHGHSYAGNPIACAAALASLEIFERERALDHVALVVEAATPHLKRVESHPCVQEIRRAGLMIGIDLDEAKIGGSDGSTPAWRVANALYERGHFTRPIDSTIQLVPPLSVTVDEIARFCSDVYDVLS